MKVANCDHGVSLLDPCQECRDIAQAYSRIPLEHRDRLEQAEKEKSRQALVMMRERIELERTRTRSGALDNLLRDFAQELTKLIGTIK